MNAILAMTALSLLPSDGTIHDRCDEIEINHYHGDDGRLIHTQVIFWDFDEHAQRQRVAAWRLWKNPARTPVRNQHTGEWELLWHDAKTNTMRRVTAASYRRTWTQYDREMENRDDFPRSGQRGLTQWRGEPSMHP